ncbi:aminomethyl-transferring glycine dehydrogenase subunit GcvPA [Pararhodospirillum oryzae]|uniref:Probable glycine dehydrogenase (decarboxylating) subunit 1 n=1 Tax=Pararhodospirillum oryzae TaxID=478448 RepID=A0A512H6C0_9PROT|nr:aminomethyl-transferring glycine dehydrogenase subunit GcvPA [Pararhodospirillum oryzae]GEO81015.1 putative glycine dehydrogenase (decarboxylating) subunit 1 [Pararhodospirillum oryzae]
MRYLPHGPADRAHMLETLGEPSIEALYRDVPAAVLQAAAFPDLPDHQGERAVEAHLAALAARNRPAGAGPCFLGAGAMRHHIPAVVDALVQRGEFMTAYTPYQPEISQGTLQALFEFQTQVALITGMEVANASMYDGASACAEAGLMAQRVTRRARVLVSGGVHPRYAATTVTLADGAHEAVEVLAPDPLGIEDLIGRVNHETACVIVQTPDVFGRLRDLTALAAACHDEGALLVAVVTEPLALGLVRPPGAMGADIVVAEGQGLAGPPSFGGPGVGLFATRAALMRQMPGRLVGQTVDEDGRRGFVLTLSTREQHIRREKATSNICTNAGLVALALSIHLALLGEEGFTRLARTNHALAVDLATRLARLPGVRVLPQAFFNEFALLLPVPAGPVVETLADRGVLAGVPGERLWPDYPELAEVLLVAVTETTPPADIEALVDGLKEALS